MNEAEKHQKHLRINSLERVGVMAGMDGGRMIPEFSRCRICPWHYFGIKSLWAAIFVTSRK